MMIVYNLNSFVKFSKHKVVRIQKQDSKKAESREPNKVMQARREFKIKIVNTHKRKHSPQEQPMRTARRRDPERETAKQREREGGR